MHWELQQQHNEVNWPPEMKESAALMESSSRRKTSQAAPPDPLPLSHTHTLVMETPPTWLKGGGVKVVETSCCCLCHMTPGPAPSELPVDLVFLPVNPSLHPLYIQPVLGFPAFHPTSFIHQDFRCSIKDIKNLCFLVVTFTAQSWRVRLFFPF